MKTRIRAGVPKGRRISPQTGQGSGPIPPDGPLARPKSLQPVGVPVEATRAAAPADNPQTPEEIALGEKLFFDGRLVPVLLLFAALVFEY